MRINNNISSLYTQGALFQNNRAVSNNLEKLSTGLRINRASDDAAGLAVSEGLRTQVRGAQQAKRNALDGISALNIAEGAMDELHNLMQRQRELAIQSATSTYSDTERGYMNEEFQALSLEIDRIIGATNFNGIKLLEFEQGRQPSSMNTNAAPSPNITHTMHADGVAKFNALRAAAQDAAHWGNNATAQGIGLQSVGFNSINEVLDHINATGQAAQRAFISAGGGADGLTAAQNIVSGSSLGAITTYLNSTANGSTDASATAVALVAADFTTTLRNGADLDAWKTKIQTFVSDAGNYGAIRNALGDSLPLGVSNATELWNHLNGTGGALNNNAAGAFDAAAGTYSWDLNNVVVRTVVSLMDNGSTARFNGEHLWIDANSTKNIDSIQVNYGVMNSLNSLDFFENGGAAVLTGRARIDDAASAQEMVRLMDVEIDRVSQSRSNIGALVNRLESTINNLTTSITNQQAAESQIRDVDFASEASKFTTNQILVQSATSMLSQANASTQGVLALLR